MPCQPAPLRSPTNPVNHVGDEGAVGPCRGALTLTLSRTREREPGGDARAPSIPRRRGGCRNRPQPQRSTHAARRFHRHLAHP
jgi:hypothetical protein